MMDENAKFLERLYNTHTTTIDQKGLKERKAYLKQLHRIV